MFNNRPPSHPWARFRLPRRLPRRLDDRGAVAVEFALILPVLVIFLYVLFEVGRGLWTNNVLQLSVEEASRFAAANPTATTAEITAVAENMTNVLRNAEIVFTITTENSPSPRLRYITVEAEQDYRLMVPQILRDENGNARPAVVRLTAMARMPVIQ